MATASVVAAVRGQRVRITCARRTCRLRSIGIALPTAAALDIAMLRSESAGASSRRTA